MTATRLNPGGWVSVAVNVAAGKSATFSVAGRTDVMFAVGYYGFVHWWSVVVPAALLYSATRYFHAGDSHWDHSFAASLSGSTVTCSLTSTLNGAAATDPVMYVFVR